MNEIWKKVTPIPPEINEGYLFECRKCGQVLSYGGGKKYPPIQCPNCARKDKNKWEYQKESENNDTTKS